MPCSELGRQGVVSLNGFRVPCHGQAASPGRTRASVTGLDPAAPNLKLLEFCLKAKKECKKSKKTVEF